MGEYSVHLRVVERFASLVDETALRQAATVALATGQASVPSALTVVVTDEETMHTLNAMHRGKDMPTDVLSFPAGDNPYSTEPGEPPYLGDVLVGFPIAESQARDAGHSTQDEIHMLAIHGVLHLLGHDHDNPDQQAAMRDAESRALDALREMQR